MMRSNTKIGDVFSVKINNSEIKYMQYVISDLKQLNSDVIRAFEKVYSSDDSPSLSDIVKEKVAFYAHCVTKWGIKMGHWEKAGNIPDIGDTANILFRDTRDYGHKLGEEPIKVSHKWYIWKVNDESFKTVGKLTGDYRKAEIGIVVSPIDVVTRMKTGKYDFFYPEFE